MRMLLISAALLLAVSSPGIADDTTSGSTDTSAAVTDNSAAVTDNSAPVTDNSTASQSGGVSQNGGVCVQGFQTATCGDFTGCALPTWQCCPNSSTGGWQWADNSSACPI
jgi:hypothetical protein